MKSTKRQNSSAQNVKNSHRKSKRDALIKAKHNSAVSCAKCNKTFADQTKLKRHSDSVHEKKDIFRCPNCDKTHTRKYVLKNHIASIHERKKKFECTLCKANFNLMKGLKKHIVY